MFPSRMFEMLTLLVVAKASPPEGRRTDPSLGISLPLRRVWDHYEKEANQPSADKALYYDNILKQCRIEATDDNYRVIIDVDDSKKDGMKVILRRNFMIAEVTGYENYYDRMNDSMVLNKITFTEVRNIPPNSVIDSATAMLTRDGYLVVDIPIDADAPEPKQHKRNVPIVENGTRLESGRDVGQSLVPEDDLYRDFLIMKFLARHYNVESQIEATDDNLRVITKVINPVNITADKLNVVSLGGYVYITSTKNDLDDDGRHRNLLVNSFILPQIAVIESGTATLTSDGYLVLDVPVDLNLKEQSLDRRVVPIVESGIPLEEWKAGKAQETDLTDKENPDDMKNDVDNDVTEGEPTDPPNE